MEISRMIYSKAPMRQLTMVKKTKTMRSKTGEMRSDNVEHHIEMSTQAPTREEGREIERRLTIVFSTGRRDTGEHPSQSKERMDSTFYRRSSNI